ncbi:MAG: TonB-dependent receptor [Phaeodactylibacter sp.]|uniref:TonB-dependent receptor n=1 Tax=Phaeodactylibacter sp. TaxID=1940289 RepID=UPI0032EE03AE
MQRILITALFLSIAPMLAFAQEYSIVGIVVTKDEALPVDRATLFLAETGAVVETAHDGTFELEAAAPGPYSITVFMPGFTTMVKEVTLSPEQPVAALELSLEELSIDMESVEVQASRGIYSMSRLRNVEGAAIYAAKKSELIELDKAMGNLAANNAREIYKSVPGLNIWENDGAGLQLAIGARGLDPNRTSNFNTRQNGYDISADALGYPESYYTPPAQALQRIEVVRGAASLQYGTQFGGLLNFVFKEGPRDRPFEFTTENTYGSFGQFNTFNSVGGTVGDLNYYAFYQYKRGDGWRPNSGYEQHTAFGNLQWKPTKRLELGLEYTHMNYLAQQPGGLADFEFQQDPQQSKRARNWFKVDWNLAALTLDYRLSSRTRINWRSFLLMAQRDALGELGPINRPDPLRERDLISGKYQNFGSEARLLHQYKVNDQLSTFLLGARVYRGFTENRQGDASADEGPDFRFLNPEDLEQSNYEFPSRNVSVFAENLFNITPRLSVTPGARFEYIRTASDGYYKERVFSGGEVIFERRLEDERVNERSLVLMGLGVGYQLKPGIELYANYSQNYRAINFSDLAVVNPNLVVDSLLTDERGYNADIGIRGDALSGRLRFDVSGFYLRYNDRIGLSEISIPDPIVIERLVAFRTNIGDARILGLEAFAEADFWKLFVDQDSPWSVLAFVNFSYLQGTYISGQRQFTGNDVELIPPVSLKTGVTIRRGGFSCSYLLSYVQEHFSDATNARFVANATRGVIPTYTVMDVSASYAWKRYRVQAGVNNLADASYFTRRATGYPGPGIIPAEPRRFYLGLRIKI